MHLLWNSTTVWGPAVTSLGEAFIMAVLAAIVVPFIQRRLSNRRSGRPNHAPATAQPQRVRATTRLASHALNMTPDQEAGLIERGLPEIVVRSGTLDYASLTSGCMAGAV